MICQMNNPSTLAFSSVQRTSHELVKKSKRMKIIVNSIPNLVPLILHFGGLVALREVYQSIRDVSRWWR
ncbi:hypothetical protein MiTa_01823 [Microcystis aeruginosa NIES-4264]|jgi:hypothetical protein|nr:hypothetical protein MiTa_01823 [Microcystis aeruginosa NIES-4264]CCI33331.1 Genome sequencing data, contig C322 [Microcystis sp. T1-4]